MSAGTHPDVDVGCVEWIRKSDTYPRKPGTEGADKRWQPRFRRRSEEKIPIDGNQEVCDGLHVDRDILQKITSKTLRRGGCWSSMTEMNSLRSYGRIASAGEDVWFRAGV